MSRAFCTSKGGASGGGGLLDGGGEVGTQVPEEGELNQRASIFFERGSQIYKKLTLKKTLFQRQQMHAWILPLNRLQVDFKCRPYWRPIGILILIKSLYE